MDGGWLPDTSKLRRRRYLRVAREVGLRRTDRILELGCGPGDRSIAVWNHENEIVGVDLLDPSRVTVEQPNFRYRQCDAADMAMFATGSFDVAISVGMLEHILPRDRLVAAVDETKRVAERYGFVVPHRYAFVEPHYRMPLFPVWPEALRDRYLRWRGRRWRPMNWLTAAEWRDVFQDPTLRLLNHWYGPLLLYRILVGGSRRARD